MHEHLNTLATKFKFHADSRLFATFLAVTFIESLHPATRPPSTSRQFVHIIEASCLIAAKMRESEIEEKLDLCKELNQRRHLVSPPMEVQIAACFGWNFCILTVQDYLEKFIRIGLLLDGDVVNVGGCEDEKSQTDILTGHRRFSDRTMYEFSISGNKKFDRSAEEDELKPCKVSLLDPLTKYHLIEQIKRDSLWLGELIGEYCSVQRKREPIIACYLILIARTMARISPEK